MPYMLYRINFRLKGDLLMNTIKRQKFVRIAEKRVNITLKKIELIGNLSNKTNYEYTPRDVEKMFNALSEQLKKARARFNGKNGKNQEFRI